MKILIFFLLVIAGCGQTERFTQQLTKCNETVYVKDDNTVVFLPSTFEKFCTIENGVTTEWRGGYRSVKDQTCGFWTDKGKLTEDSDHEVALDSLVDVSCLY